MSPCDSAGAWQSWAEEWNQGIDEECVTKTRDRGLGVRNLPCFGLLPFRPKEAMITPDERGRRSAAGRSHLMKPISVACALGGVLLGAAAVLVGASGGDAKQALTKTLWPRQRIQAALKAVERQKAAGILRDAAYQKRKDMLKARLAGTYVSQSLSVTDPPLNFIQNAGFEKVNRNSARNRSRWLWWGGWSWGGDYENSWETRPQYVHSGKHSARIRCTGKKGRIGIMTPALPAVKGASGYKLTFWARGEGDNMLFINFESGARGTVRTKIAPQWKQYTLIGEPEKGAKTYGVYFYHIGAGTIWLDDMKLVPVGGKAE